jgi:HEAT repeat protein
LLSLLFLVTCGVGLAEGEGVVEYQLEKLIVDLNVDRDSSEKAREKLTEMGAEAVPRLLAEVKKREVVPLDATRPLASLVLASATRALRVLGEMGSPAALPDLVKTASAVVITDADLRSPDKTPTEQWKFAFRNEVLRYLYVFFESERVRDTYVALAENVIEKYRGGQYGVFRWRTCRQRYVDHVHLGVDILTGIPLLIEAGDKRAVDLLVKLLEVMPFEICDGIASHKGVGCVLSPDGFSLTRLDLTESGLDPQYRIRMTCLRYLEQLNAVSAVPKIEPLLRSPHAEERKLALAVLSKLSSGAATPDAAGGKDGDRVYLRSGSLLGGTIGNRAITIATPHGRLLVKTDDIVRIWLQHPVRKTDVMVLRNGDRYSGTVEDGWFIVEPAEGDSRRVAASDVESVAFSR